MALPLGSHVAVVYPALGLSAAAFPYAIAPFSNWTVATESRRVAPSVGPARPALLMRAVGGGGLLGANPSTTLACPNSQIPTAVG